MSPVSAGTGKAKELKLVVVGSGGECFLSTISHTYRCRAAVEIMDNTQVYDDGS